jgi:hypothetical protein
VKAPLSASPEIASSVGTTGNRDSEVGYKAEKADLKTMLAVVDVKKVTRLNEACQ